ncbi:response regulator [Terriglobus tenax]|uniref:response regulator n=1 Tax=Terriglobus tenax TaxID=1111115 RepID=UPI0021E0678A|nr:response regulator transcription factor [Terriglobus tenax]
MRTAGKIRVLVADDHPLMREGVCHSIGLQNDMEVIGEVSDGAEAIEAYKNLRPDVLLMDLQMPNVSGLEAVVKIRESFPQAKIIILTTYAGDVQAMRTLKAGASAYLLKSLLRRELVDTVRYVYGGGRRVPPEIASEIALHAGEESLTEREMTVLRLVAQGNSNKQVAYELNLAEETIKAHMKNILSKLNANDRTHAVSLALKRGILEQQ